jgi:diguanylate cyclase (GGDEF)-like protein
MAQHFSKFKNLGLILSDINSLKLINDLFGHEYGDILLKTFAKILKNTLPRDAFIARLGGDEFVIVLYKYELETIKTLISEIKTSLQKNKIKDIIPSAAFGYSKKSLKESLQNTFSRAENMLYRDKVLEYDKQTNTMIESILNTLYKRTDESQTHTENLKKLAAPLKTALNLNQDQMSELDTLIELHDIGKISLNNTIFSDRALSDDEKTEIKSHPEIGYRIANALPRLKNVAYSILTHHENVDGSGYPFGLKKEAIPFLARLFRVIDSYNAMVRETSYSKAKTKKTALKELQEYSGSLYDESLVDAFKASLNKKSA